MTSKGTIEQRLADLESAAVDLDPFEKESNADRWRRFIAGEYEIETAHPQIRNWVAAIDRGSDQ
jgi:hypothetical protein